MKSEIKEQGNRDLATNGVHGQRPFRYEKRVARNRLIFLAFVLVMVLLGLLMFFLRSHR